MTGHGAAPRRARLAGFTLLELMVSVTLALALTTMAMVAFFGIRKLVNRAESRLAMHAAAQTIYNSLYRSFTGLQQSCAMVVMSTAEKADVPPADAAHPEQPDDTVTIVFMRGKEDTQDFQWGTESYSGQGFKASMNSDLLWEMWTWKARTRTLYSASNAPFRKFTTGTFTVGGVAYNNQPFDSVPQPRRTLDTTTPTSWQSTLNDNILFPDSAATPFPGSNPTDNPGTLTGKPGDIGDYEDLVYKLAPAMTQVSAFSIELVPHDGTPANTIRIEGAPFATPAESHVLGGVWLDGRMASTLTAAPDFASSDAAKRPKLVRIRFTLTDTRVGLSQSFSFSFRLPGLAPAPPTTASP